jgi:1-acyl-sn-glycerol-3-phosphate acyltransferase
LWLPFFGWGLATIDPIAINRSKKTNAMEQIIKKGKVCLDAGRWILVFPEGTRIPYGKVGHYKAGGARLAVTTGYPVIPVAHNAGRYWSKRGFIKKPGTVQMVIGPLIETKNKTPDEVLAEVKDWIEGTIKKIDEKNP